MEDAAGRGADAKDQYCNDLQKGWIQSIPSSTLNGIDLKDVCKRRSQVLALDKSFSPLEHSVIFDNINDLNRLIASGVDVNEKRENGRTALLLTVASGKIDRFKALISAGADIHGCGADGRNLLHSIMYDSRDKNKIKMVQALIDAGIDINAKDNAGDTALSSARVQIKNLWIEYLSKGDSFAAVTMMVDVIKMLEAAGAK